MVMLCKEVKIGELEKKDGWVYSEKYDGERAVLIFDELGLRSIKNRRSKDVLNRFPEFNKLDFRNCIIDGEIIIDNKGFNEGIAKRIHLQNTDEIAKRSLTLKATFRAFDIIKHNNQNITQKSLKDRLNILNTYNESDVFKIVKNYPDYKELWDGIMKNGKEGIVAKNLNSVYDWDYRSNNWLKIKNFKTKILNFNKYYNHNKGITLENDEGFRCACNGNQSEKVKQIIDDEDNVDVIVQYLEETENDRLRNISFKGVVV